MRACMHTPEVTCPNCDVWKRRWRPCDDFRGERLPDVPNVDETDGGNINTFRLELGPCWHGHDFVACDGYVICNKCEKVVHVAAGDDEQ